MKFPAMSPTRIVAILSALALSSSGLEAQKTYASAFRNASTPTALRLRHSFSQLEAAATTLAAQGSYINDINSYRDETGLVKHDALFRPDTSAPYELRSDMTAPQFEETARVLGLQGLRLQSFSSWRENDGTRLYAAAFRVGSGGQLHLGQLQPDFLSTYQTNTGQSLRLFAFDTYLDAANVRRYDGFYLPGAETHDLVLGMTEAQFISQNGIEGQNGRGMFEFESYYDSTNVLRYDAVYRDVNVLGQTRMFFGDNEVDFASRFRNLHDLGWELDDAEASFAGTPPVSQLYGQGVPGGRGVPALRLALPPIVGLDNSLFLGNTQGGANPTLGALVIGARPAMLPIFGGNILVSPLITLTLNIPPAGLDLPLSTPADPLLDGLRLYFQGIVVDVNAVEGVAMSQGLDVTFGRRD